MPLTLQNLTPADARLCLGVERFLTGELGLKLTKRRLLLAVSGGADSLALLLILHVLRPRLRVQLHVLAADHALRPQSRAEAEGVRERCDALGIACTLRELPVAQYAAAHKMGLEEAGRVLRYAALEEERKRLGAAWIATGHQLADLGEDVVLRLLRGTGWPGLGGMPAVDARRHLLRPLLLTPVGRLRALLRRCGLSWFEDESNADRRFRRNRTRHEIWPLLLAESPRLADHIAQLWRIARADGAYWDARLTPLLPEGDSVTLAAEALRGLEQAARLRLYARAVAQLARAHGRGQGRAASLFALDAAWNGGRGGTRFQFPGGILAEVRQGGVRFFVEQGVIPQARQTVPDAPDP